MAEDLKVLVAGGVSWDALIGMDSLPTGRAETIFSSSFHETTGSTGAGKALNLAKLGFKTSLHSPIGDDSYGRLIAKELASGGVEFLSEIDPKGTERHCNIMDKLGRRIAIYCAYPSFEPVIDQKALEARFAEQDIIVLNIINYCRRLIPAAQAAMNAKAAAESPGGAGDWRPTRGGLWIDIHDWDGKNEYHRDFVEAASVIFMSSDGMTNWRAFMKEQVAAGKELVVCTHGAKGASALWLDGTALDCPIVEDYGYRDSNGAGDAFFSGFLAAAARGYGKEACIRMASLAGALCVAAEPLANPKMDWGFLVSEYSRIWGNPYYCHEPCGDSSRDSHPRA